MFPDLTRDDVFRLETKRLWLRWPRASDSAAVTAFASLPEVAQMTANIPHPYPAKEADRFIFRARAENAEGKALHLAITRKSAVRPVFGLVSAIANGESEVEIGYALAPEMWGKGYATEAVRMMIDTVFALTPVLRILANSRVNNPASRRVLEKAGFAFLDTGLDWLGARGGMHPCDRFRLERADWRHSAKLRPLPPMAHQRRDEADAILAAPVADRTGELHDY
ncbi:MAG TPA: GNAT family N-acetyltransferase [Methylovirgula sp.]|nr:GNAT family N-acetyltransferase [Methylovirgula sp.]